MGVFIFLIWNSGPDHPDHLVKTISSVRGIWRMFSFSSYFVHKLLSESSADPVPTPHFAASELGCKTGI